MTDFIKLIQEDPSAEFVLKVECKYRKRIENIRKLELLCSTYIDMEKNPEIVRLRGIIAQFGKTPTGPIKMLPVRRKSDLLN